MAICFEHKGTQYTLEYTRDSVKQMERGGFSIVCDPIDSSSPSSLVPGILQTRTLEWVAISFSNA